MLRVPVGGTLVILGERPQPIECGPHELEAVGDVPEDRGEGMDDIGARGSPGAFDGVNRCAVVRICGQDFIDELQGKVGLEIGDPRHQPKKAHLLIEAGAQEPLSQCRPETVDNIGPAGGTISYLPVDPRRVDQEVLQRGTARRTLGAGKERCRQAGPVIVGSVSDQYVAEHIRDDAHRSTTAAQDQAGIFELPNAAINGVPRRDPGELTHCGLEVRIIEPNRLENR